MQARRRTDGFIERTSCAVNRRLTLKEERIVEMVAVGMKNGEIAERLKTSEHMVKNYMRTIYDKTGFSNRVELALWYVRHREQQRMEYEI